MRAILRGTKNPMAGPVARDVSGAFLKVPAVEGKPAKYWSKEEQIERLDAVYNKYKDMGGVWNATAEGVSCL